MLVKNTVKRYDTVFLRKLVSWVRKEVGLPAKKLKEAKFFNRSYSVSGWACWSGRISIGIGRESDLMRPYPFDSDRRGNVPDEIYDIVFVVAHEIQHVKNYRDGSHINLVKDRDLEPHCDRIGKAVATRFQSRRVELLAEWNLKPISRKLPVSFVDRRAAKAAADLARWTRKLKLAKTKVKKLASRVAYYERKKCSSGST